MAELERFGVSIEADLLKQFDRLIEHHNYQSRSEALRDLIRDRLSHTATQEDPEQASMGTLTLFYQHSRKDLSDRLAAIGHEHHALILTTLHFHLDQERCMEVLALRGTVGELQHLADHIAALKGIQHAKLVLTAFDGESKKRAHSHSHSHSRGHGHG